MNDQLPVLLSSKNPDENVRPIDFMCGGLSCWETFGDHVTSSVHGYYSSGKEWCLHRFSISKYETRRKGALIRIFNPENWEKNISINENHQAIFKPTLAGLYVIQQDWNDNTPGTFQGNSYGKIRYRNNYCLWIN